jgi:fatty acid desaturase
VSVVRLKHPSDWRQLFIVGIYLTLIGGMYFVPWCRNAPVFVLACAFSFYVMTVNHNAMHSGLFESRSVNRAFRLVLSFCGLFPASSVIPAHNLVHHLFDDDGQPDWAAPHRVRFSWNLLNLLHFPNVAGPVTFAGVNAWARVAGRGDYRRQSAMESVFAFGLTGLLLVLDFWNGLFFVVLPQLFGARWFLRVNIVQHDGCDTTTEWNHSRNFVSPLLNWVSVNAGYHTIHHNRAGLHWSQLPRVHRAEVSSRIHPDLVQKSLLSYLARTYFFRWSRPGELGVEAFEQQPPTASFDSRESRLIQAEAASSTV